VKHPRNCQLAVAVEDADELVEETLAEVETLVEVEELELEELDELVDVGSEDVDDDKLLDEDKVELLDDEVVAVEL
jgi:hypothetical protein